MGVALLAVMAPVGMWWYAPKVNRGLVGTWKVTMGDSPERSFGPLLLNSDGTGQIEVRDSQIIRGFTFEWRVMGGQFVVLGQNRSGFPLWDRAMQLAYTSTGSPIFGRHDRFAVHRDGSGGVHLAAWGRPGFLPDNLTIIREGK